MVEPIDPHAGLVEGHGEWVLPVEGKRVTQIRCDYAFTLVIDSVRVRIECPFEVTLPEGSTATYEPENWESLGPLLRLNQAIVTSGIARKDGLLSLTFEDGTVLVCRPHERFEAWQAARDLPVVTPKFQLIALPGGGLAVF